MIAANYLLFLLGLLGGTDILLYHSVSHGIRSHDESKWELISHSLRGPTYAALFLLLPNFELHGSFAIALMTLLAFDVGISILDFSLERQSRQLLGGLPSGEYVLHMLMAMLFGAFVACLTPSLHGWIHLPTAIQHNATLAPDWMRIIMTLMALMVFYSGVVDARAAFRIRKREGGIANAW